MTFLGYSCWKELRLIATDPWKVVSWIGVPLVVGVLLTLVMGGEQGVRPTSHLLVADHDDSLLSNLLLSGAGQTGSDSLIRVEKVTEADGRAQIADVRSVADVPRHVDVAEHPFPKGNKAIENHINYKNNGDD